MAAIGQDVRFALQGFRKSPGFTAVAIVVLALGIGVNTAIFSVVDAVVLRPLPFGDPGDLVALGQGRADGQPGRRESASWPNFSDWREQSHSLQALAAYHEDSYVLGGADQPELINGVASTANLFELLGVPPALGRGFAAGEDEPGRNRVVVLSDALWQRRFNGDPATVGRTVTIDGQPHLVIGVAPPTFRFPPTQQHGDLWTPLPHGFSDSDLKTRSRRWLQVIGRMAPGASLVAVNAELATIQARVAAQYPAQEGPLMVRAIGLKDELLGGARGPMLLLLAGVAFVLLIVCANMANLLLARALGRRKEMAVRTALGSPRRRMIRQLLIESGLLGLMGGLLGLGLAVAGLRILVSLIPASVPQPREIGIDGFVLGFAAVIALGTGLVFGIIPALAASQVDVQEALKSTTRSSSQGGGRARAALLVGQMALAFVMLVGAGLSLRSFARVGEVDPGFEARGLLTASLNLPDARYKDAAAQRTFYRQLAARLPGLPGAERTAVVFPLPFSDISLKSSLLMTDRPPPAPGQRAVANMRSISPNYFEVMGVRLLRGRLFTAADDAETAAPVVVISDSVARQHWPEQDPIGKSVVVGNAGLEPRQVVGVVGDIRTRLDGPARADVYVPFAQAPMPAEFALVRSAAPLTLIEPLRAAVQAIDQSLPVGQVLTMEQRLADSLEQRRLSALLLGLFAALALVLATVGIYGVMSYVVAQRTRELGIRLALGTPGARILTMTVGQGLRLAGLGLLIGVGGAFSLSRLLASQLYGISSTDPATYGALALFLLAAAAVASLVPARRASRLDPMISLRAD